jgi:trehalose 6-phosphate synthase
MDKGERQARMRRMRRSIREYDVFWWVDSFLRAAITKDLRAFPQPESYAADELEDLPVLF